MKKPILLAITMMVMSIAAFAQPTQSKADLEKQRASIQKEIDDVKKSLNATTRNKKETLGQLSLIQKKLRLRQAQINNINQQMNLIQGDIIQSTRDILKLRKELDTLKIQYEKSVVYAYKNRSNYDFINFLFSSTSFNDALKRVAYLRSYRKYREQQAENISSTQERLQQKIQSLNQNRNKKKEVLVLENKQRSVLEEEKQEKNVVISKLKSREKELSNELAAKKRQDRNLNNAIAAAIRRAREQAIREAKATAAALAKQESAATAKAPVKTNTNTSTEKEEVVVRKTTSLSPLDDNPLSRKLSEDFISNKGTLPWPVSPGRVKMGFGRQKVEGLNIDYDNPGITIETEANQSVKAVFDGEVTAVSNVGSAQVVIIKHGRFFSSYSNLSSVNVSKLAKVKTGQVIGRAAENNDGVGEIEFLITNEHQNFNPESWLRN